MLSGNKYTSRRSLGSAIYQCLQQIPKEDYEGESIKNQPNLFLGEIDLFFLDVIAL